MGTVSCLLSSALLSIEFPPLVLNPGYPINKGTFGSSLLNGQGKDASPRCLLLGPERGETTSLYHYLSTHPGFKKAKNKEIHYFSSRFSKEVGWYARNFPTEDECQQAVTWEASVATSAAVRPHTRKECWFHLKIFSFPFPLLLPNSGRRSGRNKRRKRNRNTIMMTTNVCHFHADEIA